MKLLDLTLDDAEHNLALDEALLEDAEEGRRECDVLRLWESPQSAVVVGRASRIDEEVLQDACGQQRIPILRRCSGGAAVVVGPGCLMYAVILNYQKRPHLRMIEHAHQTVLGVIAESLGEFLSGIQHRGSSDLTLGGRKFSGNSVRYKRTHLLYHGTLLYNFAIPLIGTCLAMPPRQPDYREGRAHDHFVTNLPIACNDLRRALIQGWKTTGPLLDWPRQRTKELVEQRYGLAEWNFRR
jgi:lipoate-protein ligase A